MRAIAGAALLVLSLSACGRSGDVARPTAVSRDDRVDLEISVKAADGSTRAATAHCIGQITGTGYLAERAGSACITANISDPVADYLQSTEDSGRAPRSRCALFIRMARQLPDVPLGNATISGVYDGKPIVRHINALTGGACDAAMWKLAQPLLTPSENALVLEYPHK